MLYPDITKIYFPDNISAETLYAFSSKLFQAKSQIVDLDFKFTKWAKPFYLLMAVSEINRFRKDHPGVAIRCSNFMHLTFPAHIGFFKSFGLQFGNNPGEASGNINYHPITILFSEDIRQNAIAHSTAVGAVIEEHATSLAQILCRNDKGHLYETLAYSLREIMRNVVEHGESDRLVFCAQHWSSKNLVEIGINDWGIGISSSLSNNSTLSFDNDHDALQLALMPGVSGKGEAVKRLKRKDEWTNSGYGLYMTSRLARNAGTFLLGSGNAAIFMSGETVKTAPWKYPGTAVRIELSTDRLDDLTTLLSIYREEAEAFRTVHPELNVLTASLASRSLMNKLSNKKSK